MTAELEGTVAIVTGAAGGLGRAVVALLRERGAAVVAEDLDPAVEALAADDVATLVGDVAQAATARAAVALARERFGAVNVLVNNAARFLLKPTAETTDEEWDGLMAANVRGAFVHAREALPALRESGDGRIVNVASISGLVGLDAQTAYCATKGAIVQLTRQLAIEHAPAVRVNAVAPGAIDTPFMDPVRALPDAEATMAAIAASHPLGRIAAPEDVAEVIAFLASPRSRIMTGAIVAADGGFTAQ
ncbi:MAG: SDR family oxidoreductase [Solirubrobacteraceae bacterium]|nr:SDR family oxidoreductase [Solirubrobacteraceae bacterium]